MAVEQDRQDFASAAMMRLVQAGLARQSIPAPHARHAGAHVARSAKSALLDGVIATHGPIAILRISDAIPDLPPEPVVRALSLARDLEDLLERWRRVERFSHRRHRIKAERDRSGVVRLSHQSLAAGQRPTLAETLLVFGVLTRFAEMAVGRPAILSTAEGEVWRRDGSWTTAAGHGPIAAVCLSCRAAPPLPAPPRRPDASDGLATLRQRLKDDPVRRWRIGDVAQDAGLSVRALQRKLAERSLSFSALVCETRLEVAADQLCRDDGPGLSEIGFIAGFSDQAHFTRAFRKAVGTTPGAYLSEFRAKR